MKTKHLWKGVFNYAHALQILYAQAYTERQAWLIMCRRLAKKHDVALQVVTGLFNGSKDNYEVKIEIEYQTVKAE